MNLADILYEIEAKREIDGKTFVPPAELNRIIDTVCKALIYYANNAEGDTHDT